MHYNHSRSHWNQGDPDLHVAKQNRFVVCLMQTHTAHVAQCNLRLIKSHLHAARTQCIRNNKCIRQWDMNACGAPLFRDQDFGIWTLQSSKLYQSFNFINIWADFTDGCTQTTNCSNIPTSFPTALDSVCVYISAVWNMPELYNFF